MHETDPRHLAEIVDRFASIGEPACDVICERKAPLDHLVAFLGTKSFVRLVANVSQHRKNVAIIVVLGLCRHRSHHPEFF
ncbi:hypothetical protein [Gordonia aurantiaca]|uniref:hypothetical protein n=1 Tax=Gordonia sp. B21 TaxID=3151852 RepID=UPI003264C27B